MDLKNTNTDAPLGKCLLTDKDWVKSNLGGTVTIQKTTHCGLLSKTTLLPNGGSVIEGFGVSGYEISSTSFHEKGWE